MEQPKKRECNKANPALILSRLTGPQTLVYSTFPIAPADPAGCQSPGKVPWLPGCQVDSRSRILVCGPCYFTASFTTACDGLEEPRPSTAWFARAKVVPPWMTARLHELCPGITAATPISDRSLPLSQKHGQNNHGVLVQHDFLISTSHFAILAEQYAATWILQPTQ